jgi:subfamily B ATP-binding cassette protein MsbA
MKKFSRILKYIGYYKAQIAGYMALTVIASALSVVSVAMLAPLMSIIFNVKGSESARQSIEAGKSGRFISRLLTESIDTHGQLYAVALCCAIIIGATFLKNLFLYLSSYISVPVRSSIVIRLRNDIFAKVLTLPIGYFSDKKKGDIMSRMTNDIGEIESSIISTMEGLIKDPILVLCYIAGMVYISPTLSLFLLILLPVTAITIGRISRTLKKQSSASAKRVGEILSILDETLGGLRVVKAFLAETVIRDRFESLNNTLFRISRKMRARSDLASPLTELLGVIVLCIILYFGSSLVLHNKVLSGGDLIAYIAIFSLMINPAKTLSTSFFNVQRGAAALERIEDLLRAPAVVEDTGALPLEQFTDHIEFRNVSFSYSGKPVLKAINLIIRKGKTVALVGSSGAGKSTLADLVPRFYDATAGEVLIDGVNIKEYSLASIRKHIGLVTQDPILFNDTIAGNISLGIPGAAREDIERAARTANAWNFIQAKPEGLETNIGDRGNKLSGGEKQRLTIARALLKNPPILILDEATSSLDTESERLVQDAINKMMQNRTSLIIAHRLSTIRHADEIIVLDKGGIAERGSHDQLLQIENGIYRKLVSMQEFTHSISATA